MDDEQIQTGDPKRQTGVPRRYGVGTLLVVTAAYAVIFAMLRTVDAHPAVFAGVALFLTVIGLGQALLFGGKKPREASILVGAALMLAAMAFAVVAVAIEHGREARSNVIPLAVVIAPALGAFLGYLSGCLIGGLFLVMDRWRARGDRRRAEAAAADNGGDDPLS